MRNGKKSHGEAIDANCCALRSSVPLAVRKNELPIQEKTEPAAVGSKLPAAAALS